MGDRCELRASLGLSEEACEEQRCVFWRAVEQAGIECESAGEGCAIQYFGLLEGGEDVASWLLSVKDRVEGEVGSE
jgi:hypothetical protein